MKRSTSLSAELYRQACKSARQWARKKAAELDAWHATHADPEDSAGAHPLLCGVLAFLVILGLGVAAWARFFA